MASVTQRIKQIKQPRGGYIPPKQFQIIVIADNIKLYEQENIHSSLVGTVVDYMTRFCMGAPLESAFKISLLGASSANEETYAKKLLKNISKLDDSSIAYACQLVGYDVCYRAGMAFYKPVQEIKPDENTIFNIHNMIDRSLHFMKEYGPITKYGFTFEGGYTDLVTAGDGDFLTRDTLWDFKVSKEEPTKNHSLQLLMYYLMGVHSIHKEFLSIKKLGIFNPRLNNIYLLELAQIDQSIIKEVEREIIGYKQ